MIEANDAAVQFIQHWLQPFIWASYPALQRIVPRWNQRDPVAAIMAKDQSMCGNIRNKIRWRVEKNAWEVKAQKTVKQDNFQMMFEVDGALRGPDFKEMKAVQYRLAIAEWNRCDHSTRRRIKAPLEVVDA